jgi:hypothetical protein
MAILGYFLALAAILVTIYLVAEHQAKKRRLAISSLATQSGWRFQGEPPMPLLPGVEPFSDGRRHEALNRVTRDPEGDPVSAFDFNYTTGSGKNSHRHRLTVAEIGLPTGVTHFCVRQEHFGHRIAGVFGMQDIDFPGRPEFSGRYLLRGPDEFGIRAIFTNDVLGYFEERSGVGAACSTGRLFLWRNRLPPERLAGLMDEVTDLRDRLVGPSGDVS